ncbi:hypothetical protein ACUY3U_05345 [Gordonia amicalis]
MTDDDFITEADRITRGYLAVDLTDAWERYLPPVGPQESVTPVTAVTSPANCHGVTAVTQESGPTQCPICQEQMTFADDLAAGHHLTCTKEN